MFHRVPSTVWLRCLLPPAYSLQPTACPCDSVSSAVASIRFITAICCWPSVAASNAGWIKSGLCRQRLPPHKLQKALSTGAQRVDMLRLAIGGQEAFVVSTMELDRGGISYTVDTLEAIHRQQPDDELFLPVGSDSLADLPGWREPARICELAIPVVVRRAGGPKPDFSSLAPFVEPARLEEIRRHTVEMPPVGYSASEIRRRVAAGQSIRYRTPRAVEKYIEAEGLYRADS